MDKEQLIAQMENFLLRDEGEDQVTEDDFEAACEVIRQALSLLRREGMETKTIAGWLRGSKFIPLPELSRHGDVPVYTISVCTDGDDKAQQTMEVVK